MILSFAGLLTIPKSCTIQTPTFELRSRWKQKPCKETFHSKPIQKPSKSSKITNFCSTYSMSKILDSFQPSVMYILMSWSMGPSQRSRSGWSTGLATSRPLIFSRSLMNVSYHTPTRSSSCCPSLTRPINTDRSTISHVLCSFLLPVCLGFAGPAPPASCRAVASSIEAILSELVTILCVQKRSTHTCLVSLQESKNLLL